MLKLLIKVMKFLQKFRANIAVVSLFLVLIPQLCPQTGQLLSKLPGNVPQTPCFSSVLFVIMLLLLRTWRRTGGLRIRRRFIIRQKIRNWLRLIRRRSRPVSRRVSLNLIKFPLFVLKLMKPRRVSRTPLLIFGVRKLFVRNRVIPRFLRWPKI